jgi:hypothetical protein
VPNRGQQLRRIAFVLTGAACLTVGVGASFAQQAHHYQLRRGDYVAIPALRWTCGMSAVHGRPIFTCTSDLKPVRSVTIWPHQITVGITRPPVAVHGGYRFGY